MLSLSVAASFAVVIGAFLGLLGGGGVILTVPVLIYALDVPNKNAIAMSLLIVSITSLASALHQASRGNVAFRPAALFAASASVGSLAGGRIAGYLPGPILLFLFAIVMLVASVAMWRKSGAGAAPEEPAVSPGMKHASWLRVAPLAFAVGFLTGLVGAGGGFLIVPVLTLLVGLPMRLAIGTSLAVISINTMAGFLGHLGHATIDWQLTLVMAAAASVGSVFGTALGGKTSPALLRRGFAAFTFGMAIFILYKESARSPALSTMFNGTTGAWIGGITAGVVLTALVFAGISALRQAKQMKQMPEADGEQWFYEI